MRELPLTEERPVPPFAIATMPVTSLPRLIREVPTTPAVALRKPLRLERVSVFDTTELLDDAVPRTESDPLNVEVAVVEVAEK
jgi:hypothetical protein